MCCTSLPAGDQKLVQIVDAALADATRRGGSWIVCRPGCTQCCFGVFSISQLDAARLLQGLQDLEASDAQRAEAKRKRASAAMDRLSAVYTRDPVTGILAYEEK